jgi:hypothetical protein
MGTFLLWVDKPCFLKRRCLGLIAAGADCRNLESLLKSNSQPIICRHGP